MKEDGCFFLSLSNPKMALLFTFGSGSDDTEASILLILPMVPPMSTVTLSRILRFQSKDEMMRSVSQQEAEGCLADSFKDVNDTIVHTPTVIYGRIQMSGKFHCEIV
jgi:hypothetical protein